MEPAEFAADDDKVRLPGGRVMTVRELREWHMLAQKIHAIKQRKHAFLGAFFTLVVGARKRKRAGLLLKPLARDADHDIPKLGAELSRKLESLWSDYGFPLTDDGVHWELLALALAIQHEPGFRLQPRGRKKVDVRRAAMLILDVENVRSKRSCSVSEAVNTLVTSPRWAKRWGGEKKRTLENRYHEWLNDEQVSRQIETLRSGAQENGWDLWEVLDRQHPSTEGRITKKEP